MNEKTALSTSRLRTERINESDIAELRNLSISTFYDAFASQNTKEDMDMYLSEQFSLNSLLAELKDSLNHFLFLLNENAEKIGYLKISLSEEQAGDLEIARFYIKREFQGFGYGKEALLFAQNMAQKLGKNRICLGVWEKNEGAIRFYERFGFKREGEQVFVLGKDRQIDFVYILAF